MTPSLRGAPTGTPAGFTLIELLVVVVIMGIVSAMILLSLGILGDDRALQQHARRMASLIEVANDEAVMQGRDFGLEFMQHGYRFVEHDPVLDRWHEIADDDLLRARQLEEGLEFELQLEDRRITLEEEAAEIKADENGGDSSRKVSYLPHVLILSSGDVTPFEIRILRHSDRSEVAIRMSQLGEIEIGADGELETT